MQQINYKDFANKIREKYNAYHDVPDLELAQRIIDKYPEYKDYVVFDDNEPIEPLEKTTLGKAKSALDKTIDLTKKAVGTTQASFIGAVGDTARFASQSAGMFASMFWDKLADVADKTGIFSKDFTNVLRKAGDSINEDMQSFAKDIEDATASLSAGVYDLNTKGEIKTPVQYTYERYAAGKKAQEDRIEYKILNDDRVKKVINKLAEETGNLGIKAVAAIQAIGEPTFDEAYNKLLQKRYDPNNNEFEKFLYDLQDTLPQTAIGTILAVGAGLATRNPKIAAAFSMPYYAALSASEQLDKKGEVYSLGNIYIDTVGDAILGGALSSLFKEKVSDTVLKTALKSFGIEGGTEAMQDLLKMANDYRNADNEYEKGKILQEAMDYVKNGDILRTFVLGGVAGGVLGAGAQALQKQINKKNLNIIRDRIRHSEAFNIDRIVKEEPDALDFIYKDKDRKILSDKFAAGRIQDVALKLDMLQKGLGDIYKQAMQNKSDLTMDDIVSEGLRFVDAAETGTLSKLINEVIPQAKSDWREKLQEAYEAVSAVIAKEIKEGKSEISKKAQEQLIYESALRAIKSGLPVNTIKNSMYKDFKADIVDKIVDNAYNDFINSYVNSKTVKDLLAEYGDNVPAIALELSDKLPANIAEEIAVKAVKLYNDQKEQSAKESEKIASDIKEAKKEDKKTEKDVVETASREEYGVFVEEAQGYMNTLAALKAKHSKAKPAEQKKIAKEIKQVKEKLNELNEKAKRGIDTKEFVDVLKEKYPKGFFAYTKVSKKKLEDIQENGVTEENLGKTVELKVEDKTKSDNLIVHVEPAIFSKIKIIPNDELLDVTGGKKSQKMLRLAVMQRDNLLDGLNIELPTKSIGIDNIEIVENKKKQKKKKKEIKLTSKDYASIRKELKEGKKLGLEAVNAAELVRKLITRKKITNALGDFDRITFKQFIANKEALVHGLLLSEDERIINKAYDELVKLGVIEKGKKFEISKEDREALTKFIDSIKANNKPIEPVMVIAYDNKYSNLLNVVYKDNSGNYYRHIADIIKYVLDAIGDTEIIYHLGQTEAGVDVLNVKDAKTGDIIATIPMNRLDSDEVKKLEEMEDVTTAKAYDAIQSEDVISADEALKIAEDIPFFNELDKRKVKRILTPEGREAYGSYFRGLVEFVENPKETTLPHEAFHAFIDIVLTENEKKKAFDLARKESGRKLSNTEANEYLAEAFARWYIRNARPKTLLERIFFKIKQFLHSLRRDFKTIEALFYKALDPKNAQIVREFIRNKSYGDLVKLYEEKGKKLFKAKVIAAIEATGKEYVSYGHLISIISKVKKEGGTKQSILNAVEHIIENKYKNHKKIKVDELVKELERNILQFNIIETNAYASSGLASLNVYSKDYGTVVVDTNFKHGIYGHFSSIDEYEYAEDVGLFGHFRYFVKDGILYVGEIQSDTFQKHTNDDIKYISGITNKLVEANQSLSDVSEKFINELNLSSRTKIVNDYVIDKIYSDEYDEFVRLFITGDVGDDFAIVNEIKDEYSRGVTVLEVKHTITALFSAINQHMIALHNGGILDMSDVISEIEYNKNIIDETPLSGDENIKKVLNAIDSTYKLMKERLGYEKEQLKDTSIYANEYDMFVFKYETDKDIANNKEREKIVVRRKTIDSTYDYAYKAYDAFMNLLEVVDMYKLTKDEYVTSFASKLISDAVLAGSINYSLIEDNIRMYFSDELMPKIQEALNEDAKKKFSDLYAKYTDKDNIRIDRTLLEKITDLLLDVKSYKDKNAIEKLFSTKIININDLIDNKALSEQFVQFRNSHIDLLVKTAMKYAAEKGFSKVRFADFDAVAFYEYFMDDAMNAAINNTITLEPGRFETMSYNGERYLVLKKELGYGAIPKAVKIKKEYEKGAWDFELEDGTKVKFIYTELLKDNYLIKRSGDVEELKAIIDAVVKDKKDREDYYNVSPSLVIRKLEEDGYIHDSNITNIKDANGATHKYYVVYYGNNFANLKGIDLFEFVRDKYKNTKEFVLNNISKNNLPIIMKYAEGNSIYKAIKKNTKEIRNVVDKDLRGTHWHEVVIDDGIKSEAIMYQLKDKIVRKTEWHKRAREFSTIDEFLRAYEKYYVILNQKTFVLQDNIYNVYTDYNKASEELNSYDESAAIVRIYADDGVTILDSSKAFENLIHSENISIRSTRTKTLSKEQFFSRYEQGSLSSEDIMNAYVGDDRLIDIAAQYGFDAIKLGDELLMIKKDKFKTEYELADIFDEATRIYKNRIKPEYTDIENIRDAEALAKAIKDGYAASSLLSIIENGKKYFVVLSPGELHYLEDETRTIPRMNNINSQIHIDAVNETVLEMIEKGDAEIISREKLVELHPQAASIDIFRKYLPIDGKIGVEFLEDVKKRFKIDFDVVLARAILLQGKDQYAYGVTSNNAIAIVENLADTTAHHEIVHLVLNNIDKIDVFKGIKREDILKAKAKELNMQLNAETEAIIEEHLAKDFEKYVKKELQPRGIIARFFHMLKKELLKIARLITGRKDIVQDFYDAILYEESARREYIRLSDGDSALRAMLNDNGVLVARASKIDAFSFKLVEDALNLRTLKKLGKNADEIIDALQNVYGYDIKHAEAIASATLDILAREKLLKEFKKTIDVLKKNGEKVDARVAFYEKQKKILDDKKKFLTQYLKNLGSQKAQAASSLKSAQEHKSTAYNKADVSYDNDNINGDVIKAKKNSYNDIFQLRPMTGFEKFRRAIEDSNIRLKVLNEAIAEKFGTEIDDAIDIYAKKDMLPRKINYAIEKIEEKKKEFIIEMIEKGIDYEEFNKYLHARHAKERNAKMKEVNGTDEDGLSGMTDKEAEEILKNAKPEYEELAKKVDELIEENRQFMLEHGLIKPEEYELLTSTYKHYVPLFRDVDYVQLGIGQGVDIKGKEYKRAKGSKTLRVIDPLANVFAQIEKTHIRAIKNEVGLAIDELVKKFPEFENIFKIEALRYLPRYDQDGELIMLDPQYKFADNVIGFKKDGKQYLITINDKDIARALKNLKVANLPEWTEPLRVMMHIWSSIKTRWSPEFLLTNFERDLTEALINLGVEESKLKGKAKDIKRNILAELPKAQKEIFMHIRGKQKSKEFDEFLKLGGDTGHFWAENAKEAEKSLRQMYKEMKGEGIEKYLNLGRKFMKFIDDANTVVELGIRYATYKELVKRGFSKERAVQSAADLTINFSRQGEAMPFFKLFYGFINPTVQGTSKIIRSLTHKEGRRLVATRAAAVATIGFIAGVISHMLDDEGDEAIPDWAKNNTLVFAIGDGRTITFWQMPYGYNVFYSFGRSMSDFMFNKKTLAETLQTTIKSAITSFTPYDTEAGLLSLVPTLLRPSFEVDQNRAWYGGVIYPEQKYTKSPKPDSQVYKEGTSDLAIFIADILNRMTGGDERYSGAIDIHPNSLEYFYKQYFGGAGTFLQMTFETMLRTAKGEFNPNETPFIRKFYRDDEPYGFVYKTINDTLERAYKKRLSEIEVSRFYRAVDVGIKYGILDQEYAKSVVKDFIRARYGMSGNILDDENIKILLKMPKEDRDRLLNAYSEKTIKRVYKKLLDYK